MDSIRQNFLASKIRGAKANAKAAAADPETQARAALVEQLMQKMGDNFEPTDEIDPELLKLLQKGQ